MFACVVTFAHRKKLSLRTSDVLTETAALLDEPPWTQDAIHDADAQAEVGESAKDRVRPATLLLEVTTLLLSMISATPIVLDA